MTDDFTLCERLPTPAQYVALRAAVGWGTIDEATASRTLQAAAFTICLHRGEALAGLARVMGDGALYFFLADLMVAPGFRGSSHGDALMRAVTDYFDRAARPGATIVLIPVAGRESFYERFGFVRCPDGAFGQGMRYAAAPPPRP